MISEVRDRRRKAMLWSAIASAALHVVILSLLFYAFERVIVPRGAREQVTETATISVTQPARPKSQPKRHVHRRPTPASARPPARHELARESIQAPAQPPQVPHSTAVSSITRDRATFAREVAQLNKGNDPHAIPTIDPASAESPSKSYAFDPHSTTSGDSHGNGIITPVRSWQDRGRDCYYARYEYTYPSGAMEDGNIPWPVCFNPATDPFHLPPHPMPFPLPEPGYALPPGTPLPPLEKSVYDEWAANHAAQ